MQRKTSFEIARAIGGTRNPFRGETLTRTVAAVLAEACERAKLDAGGAELLRLVGNAVFRLPRQRVVVKIVLTPALAHRAGNAVAAARLLAAHRIPAIRLLGYVRQPMYVAGHAVTFWRETGGSGAEPVASDLARLLRAMHRLPATGGGLRAWDPVPDLLHRLRDAGGWPEADLERLADRCAAVATALPTLPYTLPPGVVHGDARLGNLIATSRGPVLCDFDTTGLGPVEWDLAPAAVGSLRFDGAGPAHDELVRSYGFDVTSWAGFPVLRELRELKLVISALPTALGNPRVLPEARHRLRSFLAGDTAARWTRYR